jgi:hypothetical protein
MLSFVESSVNEKGSKPKYGSPVFLSLISNLSVATLPSGNGV